MIQNVEYETYDPKTPRLAYWQVASLIWVLPEETLRRLALGPFEEGGCIPCNACEALEELDCPEAKMLIDWHNPLNTSSRFNDVLLAKVINPDSFKFMDDERHELLGSIAYARCGMMYALARDELQRRRKTR